MKLINYIKLSENVNIINLDTLAIKKFFNSQSPFYFEQFKTNENFRKYLNESKVLKLICAQGQDLYLLDETNSEVAIIFNPDESGVFKTTVASAKNKPKDKLTIIKNAKGQFKEIMDLYNSHRYTDYENIPEDSFENIKIKIDKIMYRIKEIQFSNIRGASVKELVLKLNNLKQLLN